MLSDSLVSRQWYQKDEMKRRAQAFVLGNYFTTKQGYISLRSLDYNNILFFHDHDLFQNLFFSWVQTFDYIFVQNVSKYLETHRCEKF